MPLRRELPVLALAVIFVVSGCGASSSLSPAASGGGAAPASGQFCTGVKLVFFPGGTAGGGFETVVSNGAQAAQAAFGPDITYPWSDWDPSKMITQFQQALATKPDGIAIVRALHFQADIIVLDEPTMGLSLKETEKLILFVEGIRAAGKSAIVIDHNIFHVHSLADRIVVLDRARVAGEFPTSRYSLEELMNILREVAAGGTYTEAERCRVAEPVADPTGGIA